MIEEIAMKRRDFIQRSVLGSGGLLLANQGYHSLHWLTSRLHGHSNFDASFILQAALQAGNPVLSETALADAAAANDTAIVTIKVMNLMHMPMCFKLGKINASGAVDAYSGPATSGGAAPTRLNIPLAERFTNPSGPNSSTVFSLLQSKGLDQISSIPRWSNLRINRWFADILQSGTQETGAKPAINADAEFGPFPPENEVAFQAILHVEQNETTKNHSYINLAMKGTDRTTGKGGDLAFHLQKNGIVQSPLGLVCLSMGNQTKTTDVGFVTNHILGSDLATKAAEGRSVADYVSLLEQSVGVGFVDANLMGKFDSLANTDVSLRKVINDNRATLSSSLANVKLASDIETKPNIMTLPANFSAANLQSFGPTPVQSKCEFLAQCVFVKKALDIPNKPFRNFTLSLNMRDMDGSSLDTCATGAGETTFNLSNVEGMRQLALGLNILAQAIKTHRNVYVVVITEGGRGINGGDNKMSHALLMGPGGGGNLRDYLYANNDINDSANPVVAEPNEGSAVPDAAVPGLTTNGSGRRALKATDVLNGNGAGASAVITTSGVLSGLCKYLEEKAGLPSTIPMSFGNYLNVQRKV